MFTRAALAAVLLLMTACATRQTAPGIYRLINHGPAPVLVPPGVSDPALAIRTFNFPLAGKAPLTCGIRDDVFRVEPRRNFLRITVQRDTLLGHTASWFADWIAALEQQGCVPSGKGVVLAEQIVEAVPINPSVAYGLLHPGAMASGHIDLVPGYRLKLVSPILREGAPAGASAIAMDRVSGNDTQLSVTVKASADFLGYEISWYAVDAGGKLKFASAESHIGQEVTTSQSPRVNQFVFPATVNCYRLFYLTRRSQTNHNIAVLSAATRAELNRQTPAFESDPEACAKAPPQTCATLPKEIGITIFVRILANGAALDLATPSTVADALRTAGVRQPATVLPTLAVLRPYKSALVPVEFDRTKSDILTLNLAGNEELRW